jgi:hypothetical protein
VTNQLTNQERTILTDHMTQHRRSAYRRDWTVYRDLQRRGLLGLNLIRGDGIFWVSTTELGWEALRLVGVAA